MALDQECHICECHCGKGVHPGLAGSAATPVPGQPRPLLPAAPLCICRSRAGLSSSESTKQHEVLHHILAGDVKALGSPSGRRAAVWWGASCPTPFPAGFGQQQCWRAGSSTHSWQASAGRCWHWFISSAQSSGEMMSRFHPPCPAMGGGGAKSRRRSAGATSLHPGHSQGLYSGAPTDPCSSEGSAAPSHCHCPGLCLVLQALGSAREGEGKKQEQETLESWEGAGWAEMCSWGL